MKVIQLYDLEKKQGEVGLEIECEGDRLPQHNTNLWRSELDSSLKKAGSFEYVLNNPLKRVEIPFALSELESAIKKNKGTIDESVRAGVHVHLNVQELSIIQVFNLTVTYMILENLLVSYCGENRKGNLFCLRTSDAKYLSWMLLNAIKSKNITSLYTDNIRYASINFKALRQYGSIEFRAMRSTPNFAAISLWVDMLCKVKDYSVSVEHPEAIAYHFSELGPSNFVKHVLGNFDVFERNDEFVTMLRDGVNNAQDIAFAVNWNTYCKDSINPFMGKAKGGFR